MRLGDAKFRNYSGNFGWITHSQLRAGAPLWTPRLYSKSVSPCLSVCRQVHHADYRSVVVQPLTVIDQQRRRRRAADLAAVRQTTV